MRFFAEITRDFKKVLAFHVILIIVLLLFLTLFNVPAFEDFYNFYTIDGMQIARGLIPFKDFAPYYPMIMELYLGFFGLFNMNVILARCIQAVINIVIILLIYDTFKVAGIENSPKMTFFYGLNAFMLFFSIVQVNNDILLILFIMLSINLYVRKQYLFVGIFICLGFMTKVFAIILIIPITIFLLKNKEIKKFILLFLGFLIPLLGIILPVWLISKAPLFDIILQPFQLSVGHPHVLNYPYFLIHGFGVEKNLLQTVSTIIAIGLILFYLLYLKRDEQDLNLKTIYYSLLIFMLFQAFLVPWYFVWIIPLYHLVQKNNITKKIWAVQIIIWLNFLLYALPGLLLSLSLIPDMSMMENFFTTPSLFGTLTVGLGVLLLQFSIILLWTDENQDLPSKKIIILNIIAMICTGIFLFLLLF